MRVTQLELTNFRNIASAVFEPCDGVNLIWGDNAQGKTNLLESIWLFTGCRSFRGAKDTECVGFGGAKAALSLDYFGEGRDQNLLLSIEKTRRFTKNGIKLTSPAKVMGSFLAVVFSPVHLSLVKDGPYERRRFLDAAISQLKPKYALALSGYNKALAQRNMLLKDLMYHSELYDTLDVWDEKLSSYGAAVVYERILYSKQLSEHANNIYSGISDGREELTVDYVNNTGLYLEDPYEIKNFLKEKLRQNRREDIFNKITGIGPQRDDLDIKINGLSARKFGSQGQMRSCALALKLSEANIIKEMTDEEPVILLDDVMSELDIKRQDYILNHISGRQVFITCCDPATVLRMCEGKTFHIEKGCLV